MNPAILLRALVVVLFLALVSSAQNFTILYQFQGLPDGNTPYGSMVFDQSGNLYGVTEAGGANDLGAIFKLTNARTGWNETIVYSFTGGKDSEKPLAGLTIDPAGNIYGTTYGMGGTDCSPECGSVFELAAGGGAFTVLHRFTGGRDGAGPYGNILLDASGDLYGTTWYDGPKGYGTVFLLTNTNGKWTKKILYSFSGNKYGAAPSGNLIMDADGSLYGTTAVGGADGEGVAYRLSPQSNGSYRIQLVHAFSPKSGRTEAGLSFNQTGAIYGTLPTTPEDPTCYGSVYTLTQSAKGKWTKTGIYKFCKAGGLGSGPIVNPVSDAADNLYGTTAQEDFPAYQLALQANGTYQGNLLPAADNPYGATDGGTYSVYQLALQANGTYHGNLLHAFTDQALPYNPLVFGPDGNLYGTTENGGNTNQWGYVYSVGP